MTRTSFKRLWLVVVALFAGFSFWAYNKSEETQTNIDRSIRQRQRMQVELNSGSLVAKSLEELDNLTMNDHNATFLDVLRYLNYDQQALFKLSGANRRSVNVAGTSLFERSFKLAGMSTYGEALSEVDRLYNSRKVVIKSISLKPGSGYGDSVSLNLEGVFYGLDKGE